jgi:hypothetical protein|tara:strand:+ start:5917 stop:6255 length:339 start_codon:yes stop_codon:yes gene_type:complete
MKGDTMSEQIDSTTKEKIKESPEVIEISWEDVQETLQHRRAFLQAEQILSDMMLEFEKRKRALLDQAFFEEKKVYESIQSLQESYNVDPNLTYEVKLPNQEGEKAYFIRKVE